MPARAEEIAAARSRRQKIFVAVGGVVLLGLVGFQVLPGVLSSGSKNASTPPPAAVPQATPAVPVATPTEKAVKKSISRIAERDLFKPQIVTAGSSTNLTSEIYPKAPAVRAKGFVVKDPFVPQIAVATAPVASAASTVLPQQTQVTSPSPDSGTYIVVLGVIAGTGQSSQKEAARAIVAARNAGLKEVIANTTLGPRTGPKAHFTIFTGPYTTQSGLQAELQRARRNGYPGAYSQGVTGTPIGGF
jgi:hypothetical protein